MQTHGGTAQTNDVGVDDFTREALRVLEPDPPFPDFAAHEVARVLTGKAPLSPVNAAQLAIVHPARRREARTMWPSTPAAERTVR